MGVQGHVGEGECILSFFSSGRGGEELPGGCAAFASSLPFITNMTSASPGPTARPADDAVALHALHWKGGPRLCWECVLHLQQDQRLLLRLP